MIPVAVGSRRWLISGLALASLGQASLALVAALCVQRVFDALLSAEADKGWVEMATIASVFLASALGAAALEMFRASAGARLGLGYVADVRGALFKKIMGASQAALRQKRHGGLMLPFVGDLTALRKWVSDGLVRLISASVTSILLLGFLISKSPLLAAAAALVVCAATFAAVWLNGPITDAIRDTRRKRGEVANFVSSSFRAAPTVQAFNRLSREERRLDARNEDLMISGLRLARLSGAMTAVVHLAATMLVGVTLAVGVAEVQRGGMSIGLVAASISIAGLLATAVRDLGIAFDLWRRAKVSFAKIDTALAIEPSLRKRRATQSLRAKGSGLSLRDVRMKGLFKRVNLKARTGTVVRVVGESGAGKSTLLSLAARLRDPDRGMVMLNGRNLKRVSLKSLRQRVGVASASTPLMRGSIAMNLRYRDTKAPDEEVARVAEICNLAPIWDRLPQRDQTRLEEGAPELSRGEVQRLLIARAMLGSPSLLVLDEVDTHIDDETAARIAAALQTYEGIVIMTASSPALQNAATVVWRIAEGRVRAEAIDAPPERIETANDAPDLLVVRS